MSSTVTSANTDKNQGFSFGNFVRRYPHLRGRVTDLLIGDLFTDVVDEVWASMESLHRPDKPAIPSLERRHARRRSHGQNERAGAARWTTAVETGTDTQIDS